MKMTRYENECHKRYMRRRCAQLGITIPENANKRQLEVALDAYNKDAVVVHTENGVDFRQTDKPTAVYIVEFEIRGSQSVRAESEAAVRDWVERNDFGCFITGLHVNADVDDWEIIDIFEEGEEV